MKRRRLFSLKSLPAFSIVFCLSTLFLWAFLLIGAFTTPPTVAPSPTPSDSREESSTPTMLPSRVQGLYTALILGKESSGNNTDVIALASFSPDKARLVWLQIPRDTYYRFEGHPIKLGNLYAHLLARAESAGEEQPKTSALEGVSRAVEQLLALPVDYRALVELSVLEDAVDAMGGVEITLPYALHYEDPDQALSIHLPAGTQTINGAAALGLARYRAGYATADIGRLDGQKLLLSAIWRRARQGAGAVGLMAHLPSLLSRLSTNASLSDALYFLPRLTSLKGDKILFATLPGEGYRASDGIWYYLVPRSALSHAAALLTGREQSDSAPDPDRLLTDPGDAELLAKYLAPSSLSAVTAKELLEQGISIPLLPQAHD